MKEVVEEGRRAALTTLDRRGYPHAVPVVYAVYGDDLVTPIDRKPKTGKPLGRRLNIERNPNVTILVDRWSEEWTGLAWVMARGKASIRPAEASLAELEAIVARYPGYRHIIEASEVIQVAVERLSWWSWE
ncbi:MAG: pyridoxamine 5'-phosphate oxidase family protein [Actinomycetota bacterium]